MSGFSRDALKKELGKIGHTAKAVGVDVRNKAEDAGSKVEHVTNDVEERAGRELGRAGEVIKKTIDGSKKGIRKDLQAKSGEQTQQ